LSGVRYLDSSAIVKLLAPELGSAELVSFLAGGRTVTSRVSVVEVRRVVNRKYGRVLDEPSVAEIGPIIEFDRTIAERAAVVGPLGLRSLDAIHLATALELAEDLEALVTYDRRLAAAARDLGMEVASPGAPELAG
jgi:uncharacterized protein